TPLPKSVTEHCDARVPGNVVVCDQRAARRSLNAEHLKGIGRKTNALESLRLAGAGKVHAPVGECTKFRKRLAAISSVNKVGNRVEGLISVSACCPDPHELRGIAVRQLAQQCCVDQAEDGGVRTNAERQCHQGSSDEARFLAPLSETESQIL